MKNLAVGLLCAMSLAFVPAAGLADGGTNALTMNFYLSLDHDELEATESVQSYLVDQLGDSLFGIVQSIQTGAYEQISVPADVATNGYSFWRCTATNRTRWVDIGARVVTPGDTNFVAFGRLFGSDSALISLHPTNGLWAQAGTSETGAVSGVNLKCVIIEQ